MEKRQRYTQINDENKTEVSRRLFEKSRNEFFFIFLGDSLREAFVGLIKANGKIQKVGYLAQGPATWG